MTASSDPSPGTQQAAPGARAAPAARDATVPIAAVAALFLAAVALRPQLLAVGPLLPLIRDDLGLPAAPAGLLTTIPVLCMGLFAPLGPRVAARFGTRAALGGTLLAIVALGVARVAAPDYTLVLAATLGIGIAIGIAGPIPSIVVSQRLPARPALGTGAYAGGIVLGSTIAAAVAVPLAIGGAWRLSLAIISLASAASLVAWLALIPRREPPVPLPRRALALPWRSPPAWLLVAVFGLQSVLFYGVVSWVPNAFVERGWDAAAAGGLVAAFNGVGLATTIGVPLLADRFARRRPTLAAASAVATLAAALLVLSPDAGYLWISVLGLALGAVFPLALTLPLDVTDDPARVGSVAALMLLGGYIVSATGPLVLGIARDVSGSFTASLWIVVIVGAVLTGACLLLTPRRLGAAVVAPAPPGPGLR
ncbi:MAG TPA: MFS transporter [Candidatus Limnocylindrales bacterium]|nr:MFS transporter [Candidatus Limnocylindrales bacterium]